jgi:hypothetical protein
MSTVIIISSTIGKCVSCKHYKNGTDSWMSAECVSETTKVKSRLRWHNSKACSSYELLSQEEMNVKFKI